MIQCHKPAPTHKSESFVSFGFTNYEWYCPHHLRQRYKSIEWISEHPSPVVGTIIPIVCTIIYVVFG